MTDPYVYVPVSEGQLTSFARQDARQLLDENLVDMFQDFNPSPYSTEEDPYERRYARYVCRVIDELAILVSRELLGEEVSDL
jgi:hypothetical protein